MVSCSTRVAAVAVLVACVCVLQPCVGAAAVTPSSSPFTVLFLPIDERFTTYDAFLNLARATPFRVLAPPPALLPSHKVPAPLPELDQWMATNLPLADAAVISAELYLYGGLIQSRVSNATTAEVMARVDMLRKYKKMLPNLRIYMTTVVMRIPSYNGDFEEPWYWEQYGRDLFTYSYYLDAYNVTRNATDLAIAKTAEAKVPAHIVDKFVWRRARNFNVTSALVADLVANRSLFQYMYITQDDNALYGFNIEEANKFKAMVKQHKLAPQVLVYPGADEVGLTMLSRVSVDVVGKAPTARLVFRDPATIGLVPNYEGQPMIDTLKDQLLAAGGVLDNTTSADVVLLVNNFNVFPQLEAPNQPLTGRSVSDYTMFDPFICGKKPIGFADNRYSNGADIVLGEYMAVQAGNSTCPLDMTRFAYAGWNTDGNTLGTVISNTLLLHMFSEGHQSTFFNTLRILEDWHWQAGLRQELVAYVTQVHGAGVEDLGGDLPFYDRYAYKVLDSYMQDITTTYDTPWKLESTYYPWNRTFEIGFVAN